MSETQKFRLRSAGFKRDIVAEVEEGERYVDRESGTKFVVVGEVLPVGPSTSELPWSEENLRLCGCSREQFVQKDINDCPYCDRRIPAAAEGTSSQSAPAEPVATEPVAAEPVAAQPEDSASTSETEPSESA